MIRTLCFLVCIMLKFADGTNYLLVPLPLPGNAVLGASGSRKGWFEVEATKKPLTFHSAGLIRFAESNRLGLQNGSISVTTSDKSICIYIMNIRHQHFIFPVLPILELGTRYLVSTCGSSPNETSVIVLATDVNNVLVEIHSSCAYDVGDNGTITSGQPLVVRIHKNDTFSYSCIGNMTGSVINSTAPIAVFMCVGNSSCQQLFPLRDYEYLVTGDNSSGIVQIASESGTDIIFQNSSRISIGKIHRQTLMPQQLFYFNPADPVVTTLCSDTSSIGVLVPAIATFTNQSIVLYHESIKILAEASATNIEAGKSLPIEWKNGSYGRYKVGTLSPSHSASPVNITSNSSTFGVLVFHKNFVYSGARTLVLAGFCPEKIVTNVNGRTYIIDKTSAGSTFYTEERCPIDKKPLGKIHCDEDALLGIRWNKFEFNQACNFCDVTDSDISNDLEDLSKIDMDTNSITEVLQNTSNLMKNHVLAVLDLLHVTTILENTNDVPEFTDELTALVLEIYTTVLGTSFSTLAAAQRRGRVANRILQVIDDLGGKVKMQDRDHLKVVYGDFGLVKWDLTGINSSFLPIGLHLTEIGVGDTLKNSSLTTLYYDNINASTTESAITLDDDFVHMVVASATNGTQVWLTMTVYVDTTLFNISGLDSSTNYSLNSNVISTKLTRDGSPLSNLNGTNVTSVYNPKQRVSDPERESRNQCVYWNFTGREGFGAWSSEGCIYSRLEDGRDVCLCDHLTNFAILVDYDGQDEQHSLALSIISIVGLSLSIAGLAITVVSFLVFKNLRQTVPQQTLFNLALAELCSWIVFLAGVERIENKLFCKSVSVLLHYFILASFMWMLAEGVLLYTKLGTVFGTYVSSFVLKAAVLAWGIPLLIVGVVLLIDTELYIGGDHFCWMSTTAFYYSFALPVCLVIATNVVLYIFVMFNLCRRSGIRGHGTYSDNRTSQNFLISIFCFTLLGLGWIFGFLAISRAKLVFQYLFCILNSLQGFLIFVFFTLRNKTFRDSWQGCFSKKK